MDDAQRHDKIEKYLLGELSPDESSRFEADIKADPALYEQVEIQRMGLLGLQRLAHADLRGKFAKWDEELDADPVPNIKKEGFGFWMWTTVVLCLLLLAGIFLHFQQLKKIHIKQDQEKGENTRRDSTIKALQFAVQQKEAELEGNNGLVSQTEINQLREEIKSKERAIDKLKNDLPFGNRKTALLFAQLSDDRQNIRGSSQAGDSTLRAASTAYEASNFSQAINLLKQIPFNDPRYDDVIKILPFALFYDGRFSEAIEAFTKLQQKNQYLADKAGWFIVLCHLSEGRKAAAQKGITAILNDPQHRFLQNATILKEILEKR